MARSLRTALTRAVEARLGEREFESAGRGPERSWRRPLEPPLTGVVVPVIEGHRYGGVSLTGQLMVVSPAVAEFCRDDVPDGAWKPGRRPSELDGYFLALVAFGSLSADGPSTDLQWQVEDESQVAGAVASFVATLDGPGSAWLDARRGVVGVLEAARGGDPRTSGAWGRTNVVLALQSGRPADARALLDLMAGNDRLDADGRSRLSAFENTLREKFSDF